MVLPTLAHIETALLSEVDLQYNRLTDGHVTFYPPTRSLTESLSRLFSITHWSFAARELL